MINAPTIVRLIRFPKSLRLEKKGNQFFGPMRRSGPLVLSERHAPIECLFRLTDAGLSFSTGGNTVQGVEAFAEGEQRDLLLPWAIVSDGKNRPAKIILEIDLKYEGSSDTHTATVPLELTYSVRRRVIGAVAAGAAAAAVAMAAASRGRKKVVVADEDEDVELALFNIAPTPGTKTSSRRTNVKGAKVTVANEEDVEVAVLNVPQRRTAKKASSKKTSSKKTSSKKTASKKTASKKTAKKAPSKKAGARGSAKARKAAPRRTARKSR